MADDPSSASRVFSISPSVPFLKTLASALVEGELVPGFCPRKNPLQLAEATLYLPTRRAARLLPDIFQELFDGRPVLLPKILPVGDVEEDDLLLRGEADGNDLPPAMPAMERHLALTRLVMAWKGALRREVLNLGVDEPLGVPASAADAAWLAGDLATLMDEIETEEADWAQLADLVPDDYARYWQITLDFLSIVQQGWPAYLAETGTMDAKARRSALIRQAAAQMRSRPPQGPVIVAGVTGSVPATAELLKAAAGLPQGVLVLPGLDLGLDAASWSALARQPTAAKTKGHAVLGVPAHPQYGLRQLLDRLDLSRDAVQDLAPLQDQAMVDRERLVSEALRPAETSDAWMRFLQDFPVERRRAALAGVEMVVARNEADEALAAAIALREALERGETAAFVSPDRLLARRVAVELARWKVQVDDSAGRPLDQTPPAILANLSAQLAVNGCDPIDLLSLLKHPLCRLGLSLKDVRSAARALERGVLRGPRAKAGTSGLREAVLASKDHQESTKRLSRWQKIHDDDWQAILDLVERLADALEPLETLQSTSDEIPVTDLAKAQVEVLHRIARDPSGSDAELYSGETGDALAAFYANLLEAERADLEVRPRDWATVQPALMANSSVRRRLPGDPRVQILGPMEARLQSPDLMILAGLNEGVWPQRTRNDPWLNRPMKQDIGLEPPERRLGAAAHDFVQGLGARRVILSRAARVDGAPSVMSRWLQRLVTLSGPEITEEMMGRGAVYRDFAARLDQSPGPVRTSQRPNPKPPVPARPKRLSVTEIERLVRDPYAIFARHVLGLEPVDPIGGQPGAAEKGTIIHDVLAEFLEAWTGPFDVGALDRLIEVGERHFAKLEAFPAVRALWWPRFLRIAEAFIGFEAKRVQKLDKRYLEISGGMVLTLPGLEFRLTGRADRIDLLSDGSVAIVDYKTGQAPSMKQVETLLAPQMPLEAAMVTRGGFDGVPSTHPISELLYIQLKGGADPLLEVGRTPKDKDLGELADEAYAKLESLIAHYSLQDNGYLSRARVMMEGNTDGPYDHLARVQEWSVGGGGEE
ncbi:double-strand break repair protein AddB [Roseibium sp.]|uniref:double-strand break repair protein AddB n=1 Tax=Roseibium sp. TaxID=1936156 RepID=UPI003A97AC26